MNTTNQSNVPTRTEIKHILCECLKKLQEQDSILLENDVSERAITHKLAEYLQAYFTDLQVDCEYNRNAEFGEFAQKWIFHRKSQISEKDRTCLEEGEWVKCSTYPDIIVHHRGDNKNNLLIIEVKKRNGQNPEFDYEKLSAFTQVDGKNSYHFKFGVFILLDTGNTKLEKPQLAWCIKGSMETNEENC